MLSEKFIEIFQNFPPELSVFLISMIPIAEIRVSIPLALSVYKLSVFEAIFYSILGDIIPVIFILTGLENIYQFISKKSKLGKRYFEKFFIRTKNKFEGRYAKYGIIALILFVAIPLPFTGSWTAAVAAFLFRIPFYRSFAAIFFGVVLAALIITFISLGAFAIF